MLEIDTTKLGTTPVAVKRFYIPGLVLRSPCPQGHVVTKDLAQDYLSYPALNAVHEVDFYCETCESATFGGDEYDNTNAPEIVYEWTERIRLVLTAEPA